MSEEFVNPMAGKTAEEKKEFIVGKAMEIIMNSGDARNFAAQAMNAITKGNFDEAKQLLKEADKVQTAAHVTQLNDGQFSDPRSTQTHQKRPPYPIL